MLLILVMEVLDSEVMLVKLSDESTMQEADLTLHEMVLLKI